MTREDRTMIKPLRVLGDKFRRKDMARPVSSGYDTPWWVDVLTNWGRPVVAVVVLTMCAPGEHYLAHTAGWSTRLAWGMPFVLTAYAGISAVVATKRPKGSPGKRTAVAGAILSIAVAMDRMAPATAVRLPGDPLGRFVATTAEIPAYAVRTKGIPHASLVDQPAVCAR